MATDEQQKPGGAECRSRLRLQTEPDLANLNFEGQGGFNVRTARPMEREPLDLDSKLEGLKAQSLTDN